MVKVWLSVGRQSVCLVRATVPDPLEDGSDREGRNRKTFRMKSTGNHVLPTAPSSRCLRRSKGAMVEAAMAITACDDVATRLLFNKVRLARERQLSSNVLVTGVPIRRTLKMLTALASGSWIVGVEYLDACVKARSAVDPTAYEISAADCPGCRRARNAGAGTILRGLEVSIRAQTTMPQDELAALLRAAGASVRECRAAAADAGTNLQVYRAFDRKLLEQLDESKLLDAIMAGGLDPELVGVAQEEREPNVAVRAGRRQRLRVGNGNIPLDPAPSASAAPPAKRLRLETSAEEFHAGSDTGYVSSIAEFLASPRQEHAKEKVLEVEEKPRPPPQTQEQPLPTAEPRMTRASRMLPPRRTVDEARGRRPSVSADGRKGPHMDDAALAPSAPSAPADVEARKRPQRRGSSLGGVEADDKGGSSSAEAAAGASDHVDAAAAQPLAPPAALASAGLIPYGVEFELLPAHPATQHDFSRSEALAIRLYRQRLPNCNVDLPVACSPRHPGMTPHRRSSGGDFLQLLVHGSGARTAVARRAGCADSLLAACTFIPHNGNDMCELQLLAVSRGHSGKGIGSCLLAHVEGWLQAQHATTCVALAGLDTVEFWRKRGYVELSGEPSTAASANSTRRGGVRKDSSPRPPTLSREQWSLLRDPFGQSQAMLKRLRA